MTSATVVLRRIVATPGRSAAEAWGVIVDLVSAADSEARGDMDRVGGIAMSLIASGAVRDSPVVVHGVGPRLRIYCLYDDDAILGEGASEDVLPWCPTAGDWEMSLPSPKDDLEWVQAAFARGSTRITARDQADPVPSDKSGSAVGKDEVGEVDREAFFRP